MKRDGRRQTILASAAAGLCALIGGPLAVAQTLPDPTRPPAGFVDPAELRAGAGRPNGGTTGRANSNGDSVAGGLVLQSVLLPEKGRPVAVISGHYLPLGAKLGEWELKAVNERQVVLEQGGERRVLPLTPQVTKTMARAASPAGPAERRRPNPQQTAQARESELRR